jgi:putative cardiolipin synthase
MQYLPQEKQFFNKPNFCSSQRKVNQLDGLPVCQTEAHRSAVTLHCQVGLAAFLLILLSACAILPANTGRSTSYALEHTEETQLGQSVAAIRASNPGKDGIYPLPSGRDAFAWRMVLIAAAQRSLDLQYYIWQNDTTGQLMFEQVWQAAERGVRVRMLIDDQQTRGLDATLAALDAHPNIEVRLFNPYVHRGFRGADIAIDFKRINRRMHNKSFNADNQVVIMGGRNIGNEYFSADTKLDYSDLDLAIVGPAVHEVSREFDLYWNSESAFLAGSIIGVSAADGPSRLQERWDKVRHDPDAQQYIETVRNTQLLQLFLEHRQPPEWSHARIIYDDPEKVLQQPEQIETHLLPRIKAVMGMPTRQMDMISPYFVPGKEGAQTLDKLQKNGVQIRVLTNSLAATDVAPVHAGYKKYREELLRSGVKLYELKPNAATLERKKSKEDKTERHGSSGASAGLHAKAFAIDCSRIFVGSFNLDQRSSRLNTEMGAVVDSPVLARRLSDAFDDRIQDTAYEVRLAADGHSLEWIEHTEEGERIYTQEPQTGWLQRIWIDFLSILPIESLL